MERITIKPQPDTAWPFELPRMVCSRLNAIITPGQCLRNQELAARVAKRLDKTGSLLSADLRHGMPPQCLAVFAACAMCGRCGKVWAGDVRRAIDATRRDIVKFEAIPLEYWDKELQRRRKGEKEKRRWAKIKSERGNK